MIGSGSRGVAPLLAALVIVAAPASGQEAGAEGPASPDSVPVLSLSRALEIARIENPAYRRVLNTLSLNDPASDAAWGAFLPSLSFSAGTSQGVSRRTLTEDFFGRPIENPEVQTTWSSNSSQSLSMGMQLFQGSNWYGLGQTRAQSLSRTRSADAAWVTLSARVEREFYQGQQLEALVRLEEDLLDDKARDLEVARRLYSLATNTRADVLASELDLQRQERAVEEARGRWETALLALKTTLGRPDFGEFRLEATPLEIFDPAALDVEALVALAGRDNPRVLQERANVDASAAGLSSSRSQRWPTVGLSASLGRSAFGADQEGLFRFNPSDTYSGSVALSVNWPIFQRLSTSYQIAQAQVGLDNAQETLRESRLEVERQVRERVIQLESAFRTVELNRASLALADERLRLAREEYSLGSRSYEELQIAVSQRDNAERDFLTAQYSFVAARINLEEALGQRLAEVGRDPGA
jgi:outer membrane protein